MIKKCLNCGNEFTAKRSNQYFDCVTCRNQFYSKEFQKTKEKEVKVCPVCGKEFVCTKSNKIYCSRKCLKTHCNQTRSNNRYSGVRLLVLERDGFQCVFCGSKVNVSVHHKDNSGQTDNPNDDMSNLITVCKACHANIHKPRLNSTPHEIRTCPICGIEYRVSQVRIDDGRGKFCSKECFNKSMENKVTLICQCCGKEFQVIPARLRRGKVKYCSMECRKAAGYAHRSK